MYRRAHNFPRISIYFLGALQNIIYRGIHKPPLQEVGRNEPDRLKIQENIAANTWSCSFSRYRKFQKWPRNKTSSTFVILWSRTRFPPVTDFSPWTDYSTRDSNNQNRFFKAKTRLTDIPTVQLVLKDIKPCRPVLFVGVTRYIYLWRGKTN